jgi:catechol 2,3-dioxygenase-like lactoylglutathione lyase family enzyme
MNMVQAIPALPVRQIGQSVAFYREKLAFTAVHQDTDFAILRRDAVEMHLWEASDERWQGRSSAAPVVSGAESFIAGTASCRIQVVGVDELHAELQPRGILHPNAQLADQPWGTREFGVVDADGNLITFFERV